MPELPEVQTVVNDLKALKLAGRTITGASLYWPRTVACPDNFCEAIAGRTVLNIWRRAKYLVFDLSGDLSLIVHLRMSGRLEWKPATAPRLKHEHLVIEFADGFELRLHDTRKFGRVWLTGDSASVLGKLGPEPLDASFTPAVLAAGLKTKQRQLKPLLLDQSFVAGLGNIYVDEALWQAGLHPTRLAASLKPAEVAALHAAIVAVLERGLRNCGTTLGTGQGNFYSVAQRRGRNADELKVFRRDGEACPRCGATIARLIVAQRSTHVCPCCQA